MLIPRYQSMLKVKFTMFFVCLMLFAAANVYADDSVQDYSKGPLIGKNLFIPFLIHYNFPSLPAKSGEQFDLQYSVSLYYVNDNCVAEDKEIMSKMTGRSYIKEYISRDYESLAVQLGLAYNFTKQLQIGVDARAYFYYGGFLDSIIEGFHGLFSFQNGGRELYLQNQIYINIPNDNGITMFLDKPAFSFGDIDLWGKWTFLENRHVSLAVLGAFKLPAGKLPALSGSGYPDAALGLLLDYRTARYITLYAQAGAVLPFNNSYLMFNGMAGLEIHPSAFFSFNVQMNIKTSPISNNIWNTSGTYYYDYSLPQTNLLAGFVIRHKNSRWQFYFEEDPITNQGTDITLNITFSHTVNLRK